MIYYKHKTKPLLYVESEEKIFAIYTHKKDNWLVLCTINDINWYAARWNMLTIVSDKYVILRNLEYNENT